MTPLDEAYELCEKTAAANTPGFLSRAFDGGKNWELAAVAAAGVGVAAGAQALLAAKQRKDSYARMMDLHPDLADLKRENPKHFNAMFASMSSLAPAYANDPLVAGSLMRQMANAPENAGTIMRAAVKPADLPRSKSHLGISGGFGPFSVSL